MKQYRAVLSKLRRQKSWFILVGVTSLLLVGLAYAAASQQHHQDSAPTGTVINIPTNIDNTCDIDATVALNRWIASAPDGTSTDPTILNFGPNKCYRLDGTLNIIGRHFLDFRGNRSTIDQHYTEGDQHRTTWGVKYGNDLKWESFIIIGPHAEKQTSLGRRTAVSTYGYCASNLSRSCEFQSGWELLGVKRVTLFDNTTRNTYGDSVTVMWDYPENTVDSSDITIERQKIFGTGRQGISLVSGTNVTIRDSYIEGAALAPIDIEPEATIFPVRNVIITNNIFGQSYSSIVLASGTCTEVSGIRFTSNLFAVPNITSHPNLWADSHCITAYRGEFNIQNNSFWVEEWGNDGDQVARFDNTILNVTFNNNEARFTCDSNTPNCDRSQAAIATKLVTGWQIKNNNFSTFGAIWSFNGVDHDGNLTACGNISSAGPNQPAACQ